MIATLAAGLEEQIVADVVAALCAKTPLRLGTMHDMQSASKTHAKAVIQIEAGACPQRYCWHSWKNANQTSAISWRLTRDVKAKIVFDDALRSLGLEQT